MKKLLLISTAALGGLAFWRRKTLKDDVGQAGDAVKNATQKVRSRGDELADTAETAVDAAADAATDAADAVQSSSS